jgi:uncharacterized protein (DUF1501 family)
MNSRRNFIKKSLAGSAVISLSGAVPNFLLGASRFASEISAEKILVVVQLSGGNDGLNTVVPYGDDEYYKNRFTLAIDKKSVLKINDYVGFHPALRGFDKLLQSGQMSVVQGVGYPNPNRSHFESMDLWHTAHRVSEPNPVGWLGRSVELKMGTKDLPAVHFGNGLQPLALRTEKKPIPSVRSLENFQLNVLKNQKARKLLQSLVNSPPQTENTLLSYVHESAKIAHQTSHRLEKVDRGSRQQYGYPGSSLGRNLNVIAQLIGSGLGTKIYYTTLDGFDTHSNQQQAHQGLLSDLGDSVHSFINELADQGNDKRVVVLAFSEFGRRVRENASAGTDHGTAAPVFVFGSAVSKGVVGKHPSLKDLEQGDLKFKIDYRQVYAELLQNWLAVDPKTVLNGQFKPVKLVG